VTDYSNNREKRKAFCSSRKAQADDAWSWTILEVEILYSYLKKIKKGGGIKMVNGVNFFVFLLLLGKVIFSKKPNIGW
jgi:hypothetical protein